MEWASTVEIKIGDLPSQHRLEHEAMGRYEGWYQEMPRDAAYYNGLIALARHRYTNYEDLLQELAGKVGCGEAYTIIKSRVNSTIAVRLR